MFLVDFDLVCLGGSGFRIAWCMSFALLSRDTLGFLYDLPGIPFKAVRVSGPSLPIRSLPGLDGESLLDE